MIQADPQTAVPVIIDAIKSGGVFPLTVTGSSMTPFLIGGRDVVYLTDKGESLRRGDMVLYQRRSGQYVFHRIVAIQNGFYTLLGDGQQAKETGIEVEQILAKALFVVRKGKRLDEKSFWWRFFRDVWPRIIPLRPFIRKLYGKTVREK